MRHRKDIIFLSEYSINTGFGHLSRILAIQEVFQKEKFDCEIYVNTSDRILPIHVESHYIKLADWTITNWIETNIKSDSVVFIDSYLAKEETLSLISKSSFLVIYIDDFDRLTYPKGFNIRPSILKLDYSVQENYVFSGIDWAPIRLFYSSPQNEISSFHPHKDTILITFGTTSKIDLILRVYNGISESKYKNSNIIIVASEQDYNILSEILPSNLIIYKNLDKTEMYELYLKSRFVITSASTTSLELLLTKVPFIGILTADNQLNLFGQLQKLGFISLIDSLNFDFGNIEKNLSSAIESFDADKVKSRMSAFLSSNFQFGVRNIYFFIEAFIMKSILFEKPDLSHAELYYQWYSDPLAIKNSISGTTASLIDHVSWFKKKLNSPSTFMYICSIWGIPIGQLRLECNHEGAVIDYYLDGRFRGYSLGNKIIEQIPNLIFEGELRVNKLIALVKVSNIPSVKIFKSFGYKGNLLEDNVYKFVKEL